MNNKKSKKIKSRIKKLKEEISISKKRNKFKLNEFINNESSPLYADTIIFRIEEFADIKIEDLSEDVKKDEELMCVIWHFINIEYELMIKKYDNSFKEYMGNNIEYLSTISEEYGGENIEDIISINDIFKY